MSLLSNIYRLGMGVTIDYEESLKYALQAKDTSLIINLYFTLALLHPDDGGKILADGNKVIDWCTGVFANTSDLHIAQFTASVVAAVYENGFAGVPKDSYKAMQWYIKADDKGCNCTNYIEHIIVTTKNEDKHTKEGIRDLYKTWQKSKK